MCSIRAAGGRRGDMVPMAYGYGLFTGGLGAHYGAELLGCTVVPVSGGQTQRQVQLICDFRPDIIMVTPSYMLAIVEEFLRQGLDPASTSLRTGIFGAEPWTEALRAQIESRAGLQALDIYGDRKSTRLNSSHSQISYAVFCLKKKKSNNHAESYWAASLKSRRCRAEPGRSALARLVTEASHLS